MTPIRPYPYPAFAKRIALEPAQDSAGACATIVAPRAFSRDFFRNKRKCIGSL